MIEKTYIYKGDFPLEAGGTLKDLTIRYHVSCENHIGKKVIWICHALTANSDASDWWDTLVGEGKLFDTERYFVICANVIGSCYGTTGPSNYAPAPMLKFPLVTIHDFVSAHEILCRHLGIESIDMLVGGSNGGFQSIEWAVSNPGLIKNLCLLASSAVVSPWVTATLEAQRMAIEADASFVEQKNLHGGAAGLAAARAMALTTYRNYDGYLRTQKEPDSDFLKANRACTYERYQGEKLVRRFDAYSYYSLANSVDTHNIGRNRGGVEAALARIEAKTLCVYVDSDILFTRDESARIVSGVKNGVLEGISSDFGHDGFLLEYEQIAAAIKKHFPFMNN